MKEEGEGVGEGGRREGRGERRGRRGERRGRRGQRMGERRGRKEGKEEGREEGRKVYNNNELTGSVNLALATEDVFHRDASGVGPTMAAVGSDDWVFLGNGCLHTHCTRLLREKKGEENGLIFFLVTMEKNWI